MPLLFKIRLPKKNKMILCMIFCIGMFTIVAAALNKYYSFTHPFGNEWTIWYLRESYTAILCANLPLTYPLIQRIFRLRNWSANTYNSDAAGTVSIAQPPQPSQHSRTYWHEPRTTEIPRGFRDVFRRTESQEDINGGLGKQKEDHDPDFITSAIEMEDTRAPHASHMSAPASWRTSRSAEDNTKSPDLFHPV